MIRDSGHSSRRPSADLAPEELPGAPGDLAPEELPGAPAAEALTDLVLTTFHLNGRFLEIADALAAPAGLTAARWQVVGAVLRNPQTVAGIARTMGLARQSVQRIADLLVADGFAVYVDNPAHKRAKLLMPTQRTREAIPQISARQFEWATAVGGGIGADDLRHAVDVLRRVARALDTHVGHDADARVGHDADAKVGHDADAKVGHDVDATSRQAAAGGPLPARNPSTGKVWSHPPEH